MTLTELFETAASRQASDLHLASGERPRLRIAGELVPLDLQLDLRDLLQPMMTPEASSRLAAGLPVERTIAHGDLAFNGIVFRSGDDGLAATFRIIAKGVPPFEKVAEGAEALFRSLVDRRQGLVLIVGATGSGKWTTACMVVDTINAERGARIFVATHHPSFLFESRRGMVSQIHVGQDCEGYARALEIAHQADLDVLAMEDVPTLEALRQTLSLAERGHLVIANLGVASAAEAVARLVDSAGDEAPALRRALADNLVAITGQRLVVRKGEGGRVPVYEWILNTPRIREALLSGGDVAQAQAEDSKCRTVEAARAALVETGKIAA